MRAYTIIFIFIVLVLGVVGTVLAWMALEFNTHGTIDLGSAYLTQSELELAILVLGVLSAGLLGLLTSIAALHYFLEKHGKEEKIDYDREYEQELPYDYPPAYAGALLNDVDEAPLPKDFFATILYLDWHGLLDIEKAGKDYNIVFKEKREDKILEIPSVRKVYKFLYGYAMSHKEGEKEFVPLTELEYRSVCNQRWFNIFFKDWQASVQEEMKTIGLLGHKGGLGYYELIIITYALLSALFLVLLFAPIPMLIYYLMVGMPFGFFFFGAAAGIALRRYYKGKLTLKSSEGNIHYHRWKAFRRYVRDFSEMEEHPVMHIKLWDEIMVYSVSLGVAKEAVRSLRVAPSEVTSKSVLFVDGNLLNFNSKRFYKAVEGFSTVTTTALPIGALGAAAIGMSAIIGRR